MLLRTAAVASLLFAAQTMTPPRRVAPGPITVIPGGVSRVMTMADAQSFARALAEAGHAAGFIMPKSERQASLPADSGEMMTLDDAVAAFTARGAYSVTRHGRALVFRHAQTPADVMTALDTPHALPAGKPTFSAALFDTVLRSLARVRVAGGVEKEPGAGPECPVENRITMTAGRASTIDTLNSMIAQAKGVGWLIRFGGRGDTQRLQIGYVCGNGVWSALSVPGW